MKQPYKSPPEPVLVLLAPGFEESQFVHYISRLRDNHVPVSLIGLSAQRVSGLHGLTLHPDSSLNQLPGNKAYPLVLMMGGHQYLASLMADPRVHQLLGDTLERDGYIAADQTAESIIPYTSARALLDDHRFIKQENMSRDEFVQYLIKLVKNSPLP